MSCANETIDGCWVIWRDETAADADRYGMGYELCASAGSAGIVSVGIPDDDVVTFGDDYAEAGYAECFDATIRQRPEYERFLAEASYAESQERNRALNSYCRIGDHRTRCPEDVCSDCGGCERHYNCDCDCNDDDWTD